MDSKNIFKDFMSFDEMAAALVAMHPYYVPNRTRVGRFAKAKGYVVRKQVVNHKQNYIYVKAELAD
jgi:hypothetical protein|nr:MAG TPA: hypothetical protein [Bacteriophage sp.]